MPKPSPTAFRRLGARSAGLVAAGVSGGAALTLAVALPATAASGAPSSGSASSGPAAVAAAGSVSVLMYTPEERKDALAYWTPARMKAVGKSVDLGPTGPKAKPWRGATLKTVGRLFFVNANGADTWCTATAVKSKNRSTVMTAAHCVRRGSSPFNTNTAMVFVPGYVKGTMPNGVFAVRSAATPRSWEKDSVNDMSALLVDADKNGKELTDVVGGQAIAFDRPVGGTVSALGYSATRPQLGEGLLHCVGPAKKKDGAQAIPCDMTGGSSGGPWLADFNTTTGQGVLVSVNSALDSLTPTEMQGEVFGPTARRVYDRVQHG